MIIKQIVFATRKDYLLKKGGDTIQLLKTKSYLESLYGYNIVIITDAMQLSHFPEAKIVHVFNLQTEKQTLEYVLEAKKHNKKVVLSTIYWNLLHSYVIEASFSKFGSIRYAKFLSYIISFIVPFLNRLPGDRYLRRKYIEKRKNIIDCCDMLLPNSYEELSVIESEFGYSKLIEKAHVVPNAVDLDETSSSAKDVKGGVLIVGRIEPNKNQLNFIKAIKKSKLKNELIYIIGRVGDYKYYDLLKKESLTLPNLRFIEEIPYEDVVEYYKKCKVHVLPSFRESPGLVSLEALYYGCNIVVAEELFCPIKYYEFSKYGFVCDPYSSNSIALALEKAYEVDVIVPPSYFNKFSFKTVAIETHKAYEKTLSA
ncbi:glycosyltransferase family 4 protein [Shewanella baltica]|uniref:glycosyltransferase family 4 protein n=1 Tax=Shewanella baltica TaxID=62322 RepID=UPI00217CD715|nr:glycosyltransferase family 4 protein [Shewanella baltica]MCS6175147.1 glycosyltransferase family 4 protein [Shewanella baltica]